MAQAQQQIYAGGVPSGAMNPAYSAVAAAPVMLPDAVQTAQQKLQAEQARSGSGVVDAGLFVGEQAAWMTGHGTAVGGGASTVISAIGSNITANRNIESMIEAYRPQISAATGVPMGQVTETELRVYAENNEVLKEALDVFDESKYKTPISSLASATAGIGALALTVAPTVAGVATASAVIPGGALVGLPLSLVASWLAGKTTSGLIGVKDQAETSYVKVKALNEKLAGGNYLNAADIFDVYVAMDKNLAAQVEESTGKPWADLDEDAKAKYLSEKTPDMLAVSSQEAYLVNSGAITPEQVLFTTPEEIGRSMQVQTPIQPRMQVTQAVTAAVGDIPANNPQIAANNSNYDGANVRRLAEQRQVANQRNMRMSHIEKLSQAREVAANSVQDGIA